MGGKSKSKKKKVDPEKKARLKAAKQSKQDKATRKRENKLAAELAIINGEEPTVSSNDNPNYGVSIDELLASYAQDSLKLTSTLIEEMDAPPSPRANFSITFVGSSGNSVEFFLYGGEHYNGVENVVYDELFKCTLSISTNSPTTASWKKITSAFPRPAARCSHQTVLYRDALYVLGGELATTDQYHHYKDFWRFDLKTNTWSEIGASKKSRSAPSISPRSGHKCLVWRNYMLCFGGFYDSSLRETKWFNDLHIYNFATQDWLEVPYSKLSTRPPPRSAFAFGLDSTSDIAFVYGGFSKLKSTAPGTKAEGKIHSDLWSLNLKPIPQLMEQNGHGKLPSWDKLSKKGDAPSPRSGMNSIVHKRRIICFGGVSDSESENHILRSIFYDELYALDMDRKRWFRLNLKKKSTKSGRRRKLVEKKDESKEAPSSDEDSSNELSDKDNVEDKSSSGWDLNMLKSNLFAFIDQDGNIIYEKIESEEGEDDGYKADIGDTILSASKHYEKETETSKDEEKESETNVAEILNARVCDDAIKNVVQNSEVMKIGNSGKPEAVRRSSPLPRINTGFFVKGNTLFIYGGLLEIGDREVTLDDFWMLDLTKCEKWICIQEGSMHCQIWKGVQSDNDESYVSGGGTTEMYESDSSDEVDIKESTFEEMDKDKNDADGNDDKKKKNKKTGEKSRKSKKGGMREEIERLKEQYGLDGIEQTPQIGEDLTAFYSRTALYWNDKAIRALTERRESEAMTDKELRRAGFSLAQERFLELKPVLDRLYELSQLEEEIRVKKEKKRTKKQYDK